MFMGAEMQVEASIKQSVFYRQRQDPEVCQGLRVLGPFKEGVFKCGIYIKQAKVSVLNRPHLNTEI